MLLIPLSAIWLLPTASPAWFGPSVLPGRVSRRRRGLRMVATLIGAVRIEAATAARRPGGTVRGRGLIPAAHVTLPAHCRTADVLTVVRIGRRRWRDANADGRGANGHGGDDCGDLLHG